MRSLVILRLFSVAVALPAQLSGQNQYQDEDPDGTRVTRNENLYEIRVNGFEDPDGTRVTRDEVLVAM